MHRLNQSPIYIQFFCKKLCFIDKNKKRTICFPCRNIGVIETKESELEEEKSVTPDKGKDDHQTPTKGRGAKDKKEDKKDSKDKERKRSAERKTASKGSRRNSIAPPSPPPGQTTPISDADGLR